MNVIFEGALSRSWGMQDVLKAVAGVEKQPFAILRVTSPAARVTGRLAISDGNFIVGAIASEADTGAVQTGYAALKRILSAQEGNFAFLDTDGKKPAEFDDSVFVSLDKVLSSMPNLPDNPADLFDEKSLLDKVFGMDEGPPSHEVRAPAVESIEQQTDSATRVRAVQASEVSGSKPAWQMFQPLLSGMENNRSATQQDAISAFPYDFEDTGAHKQSLGKLRGSRSQAAPWYKELVRESLLSRTGLIWVVVILLSLVATLFGITAVKQHSSLTIQRSDAQRIH